jgi:hypothetical protein
MDENQLKGLAFDRVMVKKRAYYFIGVVVAGIGFVVIARYSYIFSIIPLVLFLAGWFYFFVKESKKVLNFVKGKEEPVDLDELDG